MNNKKVFSSVINSKYIVIIVIIIGVGLLGANTGLESLFQRIAALEARVNGLEHWRKSLRPTKHKGIIDAPVIQSPKISKTTPFQYTNINVHENEYGRNICIGEVTNNSTKYYDIQRFTISFYDKDRNLLAVDGFYITKLDPGKTKTFSLGIEISNKMIAEYSITFD